MPMSTRQELVSGKKVEPPIFPKGNNSFFFFGKLKDREAHLSGKQICKPKALFANKSPFRAASPSHLPMQQEPCELIMVATERQLKTIETQKANKPNSCFFPSKADKQTEIVAEKCLPTLGSSLGLAVLQNGNKGKINISMERYLPLKKSPRCILGR